MVLQARKEILGFQVDRYVWLLVQLYLLHETLILMIFYVKGLKCLKCGLF